jgi:hypothetical protein
MVGFEGEIECAYGVVLLNWEGLDVDSSTHFS